jgi:hypothetical protein
VEVRAEEADPHESRLQGDGRHGRLDDIGGFVFALYQTTTTTH